MKGEHQKIQILREYFKKKPSVVLAFVFGSFAEGREMKESDIDIAIYVKGKIRRAKLWLGLTRILGKEVDLVYLNDAPASLISNIFKNGIPLKIKDKKLYWELYLKATSEAEDFLEFLEDFYKIKQEAKSLTKEAKERLIIRIDFLKEELEKMDKFKGLTLKEYSENWEKRKIIERWTETIINATIDIAKIVLASEQKRMPKTYGDALFELGTMAGLTNETSEEFAEFASLRNILAHEYLEVIYGRVQEFIERAPSFFKKILNFLEKYLK